MPKHSLDKETKKAILKARGMVEAIAKADSGEAETKKRVEYVLQKIMGYDRFKHLTEEYAIKGVGDTTYCDMAIQLEYEESSKPDMFIECKRVNIDLAPKHLKQAASYCIDKGCDWVLLTNSRTWRLYHVSFGKPPQVKLIESWDLINDDPLVLAQKFGIISCKNLKHKGLEKLWEKRSALNATNLLKTILSEESIKLLQRRLKKMSSGVRILPEDIVSQFRHLLNETSLAAMDKIKISLPAKQHRVRKLKSTKKKPI